jgi:hypothetical protein
MYDKLLLPLFEGMDANAPGLGVAWAGETTSPNWFDIAREYTEKWHHQQQLRDATERAPLYAPSLLVPVLETFARGLPFAYRNFEPQSGTSVSISTIDPITLSWTLKRDRSTWSLWSGIDSAAQTSIIVPADMAWRIWTKSTTPDEARQHIQVVGDSDAVTPLVEFVAIMAVHPETGERALYVNPGFTSHILDVSRQESDLLLELFFNQITKPAYTTRFRWNNGDIAFWDNRATAHLAPQDLDHLEVERILYRTTITGEVPVGPDGFRSQVVEGEVFSSELPTVLKNKDQRVEAESVLA